ncbi:MAG TPA: methyltransferase domain-containing protein [Methylomirabilota bacterium]|nr:methyltransferase domain-containing protein [Methylomirabilota bacterium]
MSPEERWQLSGNAAEFYERYVRLIMEPWVHCLVEVAALQPAEHVLDVACGTGFVARFAAQRVGAEGRVVGVDLNASMIEAARAASGRDPETTIEWRIGDAATLPFENRAFDVVLCQQGVQFFPDRVRTLQEMRRVLRPGGRLAFTVWGAIENTPYFAVLADALTRHVSAEAGSMVRAPCALHDHVALHGLVASAGFRNVDVRPTIKTMKLPLPAEFVPSHLAALPMAQEIARVAPERRAALLEDMTHALSVYRDREQLTCPAAAHVVTANA